MMASGRGASVILAHPVKERGGHGFAARVVKPGVLRTHTLLDAKPILLSAYPKKVIEFATFFRD